MWYHEPSGAGSISRTGSVWQVGRTLSGPVSLESLEDRTLLAVTSLGTSVQAFDTTTLSYTVAAGNDRLLIVSASDDAATDIQSVSFNGMALTQAVEQSDTVAVDSIWYLALGNIAIATTANIVVTSAVPTPSFIGAIAFQGVDQTTPVDGVQKTFGSETNVSSSLMVSSAVGNTVFDVFDAYDVGAGTHTAGSGQTLIHDGGVDARDAFYSTSAKDGAASVTMSWTSSGQSFIHVAVDINQAVAASLDYGDAPDTGAGTGTGNYNTLASDNGPSHVIVAGLFLGDTVDDDTGTLQNAAANADDVNGALLDDEDGVLAPAVDLIGTIGAAPTVTLLVTNTTGSTATLSGWIDYSSNGVFDNATERAQATINTARPTAA